MGDEFAHGLFDQAVAVQRGFEVEHVERRDAEGAQVFVLFVAQPGNREMADRIEIGHVACRADLNSVGVHALAGKVGLSDVFDVLTAIAVGRPARTVRLDAGAARLHR